MTRNPFASKRVQAGLAVLAIGGAVVLLLPSDEPEAPMPTPAPAAPPPAAPPVAPTPIAASTAGLQLRGVLGYGGGQGAAIFGLSDGRQRLVRVGGDIVPGVRLEAVASNRAFVHDGAQRLEFVLPEMGQAEAGAPVPATPAPPPVPAPDTPADVNDYRFALRAERDGEAVRGYRIAPGASLPLFARAGLQPGDVILAVNGTEITDEERLMELPTELATASSIEIDYERNGRRQKATVPTGR